MRRAVVATVTALLVVSMFAAPSQAGKKPVVTTMHMHGNAPAGEIDGAQWAADGFPPTDVMPMDSKAPTGSVPKTMGFAAPPFNDKCSGLPLAFPTWVGTLKGTIKGDAKLALHFYAGPGAVTARLWVDTPVFSCNDSYVEPASEIQIQVPPGHNMVTATFHHLNLKATELVMIEVLVPSGANYRGQLGRLGYDSTDVDSTLKFSCVPASGATCTP